MSKIKLDKSEKELLASYESGEFKSVLTPARKKRMKEVANNTIKKDKRINIRISNRDLSLLQRRAISEGIPYQTLVSSILHKYVDGQLKASD